MLHLQVKASAFAPMFTHVSGEQWHYDLIVFNASHMFALPSYSVQCMLNNASNGYTVSSSTSGSTNGIFKTGMEQ